MSPAEWGGLPFRSQTGGSCHWSGHLRTLCSDPQGGRAHKARVQKNATFIVGRVEKLVKIFEEKISENDFFDGAVNIHTNLGYGSSRDDKAFLSATRGLVKKGGLFILTAQEK